MRVAAKGKQLLQQQHQQQKRKFSPSALNNNNNNNNQQGESYLKSEDSEDNGGLQVVPDIDSLYTLSKHRGIAEGGNNLQEQPQQQQQQQLQQQKQGTSTDSSADQTNNTNFTNTNNFLSSSSFQMPPKKKQDVDFDDGKDLPAMPTGNTAEDERERKRLKRLLRNRVSAQHARERKKAYMNSLENAERERQARLDELENRCNTLEKENEMLREVIKTYTLEKK